MPLDVKPLSPARRAAAVGVMCVLLAASLGFAQLLVYRQQHVPVSTTFPIPAGAVSPVLVNSDFRRINELLIIAAQVAQAPVSEKRLTLLAALPLSCRVRMGLDTRRFTFYLFPDVRRGQSPPEGYLPLLFASMTANPELSGVPATVEKVLGGEKAIQTEMVVRLSDLLKEEGKRPEEEGTPSAFAMMRLTIVNDQVIAVGFSGAGRPSAADRKMFDDYCKSVHMPD